MIVKGIRDEDFVNYKKPSMFISFPSCNWKCEKECGRQVCQNGTLATAHNINVITNEVVLRYFNNPITHAVVIGGLEPFDSYEQLYGFIESFRIISEDDIVIYTGYYKEEIINHINELKDNFKNIIVKFGRYIPDQKPHYDPILGIELASDNQHAEVIS